MIPQIIPPFSSAQSLLPQNDLTGKGKKGRKKSGLTNSGINGDILACHGAMVITRVAACTVSNLSTSPSLFLPIGKACDGPTIMFQREIYMVT